MYWVFGSVNVEPAVGPSL